ncbi:hypothetical protein D3C74_300750 [compost metagenome]
MGQDLGVADRALGGAAQVRRERTDLVEQSLLPHALDPTGHAGVERLAVAVEPDLDRGAHVLLAREVRGERFARDLDDLERPHDATGVGGADRRRGAGVEPRELGVQGPCSLALGARLEARADVRVGAREVHLVEQCPHVQARAADDDRASAPGVDRVEVRAGRGLVVGDRGVLAGVQHVELVVDDPATLGDRDLRGPHVHAAVELVGVGVDDLGRGEGLGEVEGEVRLPGRGGADDGDDEHPRTVPGGRAPVPRPGSGQGSAQAGCPLCRPCPCVGGPA